MSCLNTSDDEKASGHAGTYMLGGQCRLLCLRLTCRDDVAVAAVTAVLLRAPLREELLVLLITISPMRPGELAKDAIAGELSGLSVGGASRVDSGANGRGSSIIPTSLRCFRPLPGPSRTMAAWPGTCRIYDNGRKQFWDVGKEGIPLSKAGMLNSSARGKPRPLGLKDW